MKIEKQPEVLNFGKYKGQPIEVLAQDKQYTDWLMAQDWFQERYSGLRTLIINNFNAPAETPEHNSLQALFVDEGFIIKLAKKLFKESELNYSWKYNENSYTESLKNKESNLERCLEKLKTCSKGGWKEKSYSEEAEKLPKEIEQLKAAIKKLNEAPIEVKVNSIRFEHRGSDVCFQYSFKKDVASYYDDAIIELKPSMGDDYPAILRQMKANNCNLLIIKTYTGVGASFEQVSKMFSTRGIKILFLTDIE